MKSLGQKDAGSKVELVVGDEVAIELPETPTSGFRWSTSELPAVLRLADDRFDAPGSTSPGAAGTRRMTFQAIGVGGGTLLLQLAARTPRLTSATPFTAFIEVIEG